MSKCGCSAIRGGWLDVVIGGITVAATAAASPTVAQETLGLAVNGSFLSLCLCTGYICVVRLSGKRHAFPMHVSASEHAHLIVIMTPSREMAPDNRLFIDSSHAI